MSQKQYWSVPGEINNLAASQELQDEFKEELPFDLSGNLLDATTPRRDFLKFLGFSTLAATLVAGCEMPVRKAIPYAIKPEDIVPGVPNYYASTFVEGGDWCPIIIKTRDGRPIKIEGNDASSITKGGTNARVQASVLNLYDKARIRHPYKDGNEATFDEIDHAIKAGLGNKSGYLVTPTIISPTTKEIITQFLDKNKNFKHVVYDAVSCSGMLMANEACYGKRTLPTYHFDKATTIVSLDADFLGTWLSPVEFSKAYAKGRKITAANPKLSKHYQVESLQTITGAAADVRATCKPSELGLVVVALYNKLNGGSAGSISPKIDELVTKAAEDLKKGNGLVVCASNDMHVQTIVNAINDKIGANGTTINWTATSNIKQGTDKEVAEMVEAMASGNVGTVLLHGVNPVYDYFDNKKFADALSKVAVSVSFGERMDETAQKCKYILPDHNYLESWGDAEPKPGYFSLMQPGIAPLFKTRAFQDALLNWTDANTVYADYWKKYWLNKLGSQEAFDKTLQFGLIEPNGEQAATPVVYKGAIAEAVAKVGASKGKGGVELVVYQKIAIGAGGAWSNNPWLQELPDPITRVTWDNYVCVSPKRAKELQNEVTGFSEVEAKRSILEIKGENGYTVELPLMVVPGMHNDVVAIATGFGRDKKVGMAAASDETKGGKNAFPFRTFDGTSVNSFANVSVAKTQKTYELAFTQSHSSYEGRPVVHEFTLEEFAKDPKALLKERGKEIAEFSVLPWEEGTEAKEKEEVVNEKIEKGYREKGTLYDGFDYEAIKWGMSIDLNSCTGCGTCVVSCMAENNISIVGKEHVMKSHEMHWIRIDRYFSGMPEEPDTIQTIFQPMMCQHCDNAPCENVCPVSATNHSSEGLNQMAYNRCIGTKYCANNCPYKVRHFNWMDWNGADCFDGNQFEDGRRDDINDDLTRMVLNPDVTVRSRGVMEKCSFCVQRLQEAKLVAKKEGHPLRDGDVKTACQQACPTDAITFGNVNDKNSAIYKLRRQEQQERTFYVLEHIHVLPNVNYLARVRNTDMVVAGNLAKDKFAEEHI
jgi:MoCo/4Fe-4S cofactor protein with predicted Tat translocation signal